MLTIQGLQEAQQDNLRMVAALQPRSGLGQAVHVATVYLHRAVVANTHVDTGSLRASHRMDFSFGSEPEGVIHIDEAGKNPRSGQRTAIYGPAEENRGGEYEFYGMTFEQEAEAAGQMGVDTLMRLL